MMQSVNWDDIHEDVLIIIYDAELSLAPMLCWDEYFSPKEQKYQHTAMKVNR